MKHFLYVLKLSGLGAVAGFFVATLVAFFRRK